MSPSVSPNSGLCLIRSSAMSCSLSCESKSHFMTLGLIESESTALSTLLRTSRVYPVISYQLSGKNISLLSRSTNFSLGAMDFPLSFPIPIFSFLEWTIQGLTQSQCSAPLCRFYKSRAVTAGLLGCLGTCLAVLAHPLLQRTK